jgi:predicted RNA-binding Zn ribbon-like protein
MTSHPVDLLVPGDPAAVRFMATVWADREGGHDSLADARARDLRALLHAIGVLEATDPPPRVTAAQLIAARRLRDALRRLAAAVTGDERPAAVPALSERAAVAAVNAALAAAPPVELGRTDGRWRLVKRRPIDAALGALAREGAALITDPERPLRACHAPGCVLYFVRDHPRRAWCGVTCGNRVRAARHYARTRATR